MEIKVVRDVLADNDALAAQNRSLLASKGVFMINVMSSPGSGKTTLLEKTLARLAGEVPTAVIVGDICTTNDATRLARSGVPVVQINTEPFGGDCHLGAHVIAKAMGGLDLDAIDLLIVENVGNLVCPAEFDIGADQQVVVFSVTEGEDKPLKYPLMFRVCNAAVLSKTDLLPHLTYDKNLALTNIGAINPKMPVLEVSSQSGEGLEQWLDWLREKVRAKVAA